MEKGVEYFNRDALKAVIDGVPGGRHTLAAISNVSYAGIQHYLNGRGRPQLDTVKKLADSVGVPVELFVDEDFTWSYPHVRRAVYKKVTEKMKNVYEKQLDERGAEAGDFSKFEERMKKQSMEAPYPYNLIDAVCGGPTDVIITYDMMKGIDAAISSFTDREQQVIKKHYELGLSYREIAKDYGVTLERIRQIDAKTIRKLRHPARFRYIKFGLTGSEQFENMRELDLAIEEKKKELQELSDAVTDLRLRVEKLTNEEAVIDKAVKEKKNHAYYDRIPIEMMELSVRSYNCLRRAQIKSVGDLIKLASDEIRLIQVRNFGKKCADEIYKKLWELYGIDPRRDDI